jgi:hypothetical protein
MLYMIQTLVILTMLVYLAFFCKRRGSSYVLFVSNTHTHTQQQQQQQKQEEQEKSLKSHSCKFLYATYVFPSKESCSLLLHGLHKMD